MSHGKIENKYFEDYGLFLIDKHRPPSRGGNNSALHSHTLTTDGVKHEVNVSHSASVYATEF